ncbi:MAG: phosphoglucosamine mutase [Pirellulales bacterium]
MTEPIISVSGLRGIVGESLSPEVAVSYVAAFVGQLGPGPIVVSRDGRTTGAMLADAVHSAVQAAGRDCLDAGIAATPTTGVLVRELKAAGGVQISASHNPPPYNGIKLFGPDGRVVPAAFGKRVLDAYRAGNPQWAKFDQIGSWETVRDTTSAHLTKVLALVDVPIIRKRGFRVLLDSNRGSGSVLGVKLLEALACKVELRGGTPDGRFEHPPEPTEENLASVAQAAASAGCDVGFCQDPDADRLALLDERGRYIGEEYTSALCTDRVLQKTPGPVVTNCSTSRMTEDLAAKYGVPFSRSAVGEANVADEMIARRATFGGEGNGGPIDPRVGYVRDSFVGMALILDGLAARGGTLSQWAASLPRYEIEKTKMTLAPEKLPAGLAALREHFRDARFDTLDGLRLDWPNRWLLVRASNTEPIVRAIAEAPPPPKLAACARKRCKFWRRFNGSRVPHSRPWANDGATAQPKFAEGR